jgi:transcriptional regulator with XRE-family HTH domain
VFATAGNLGSLIRLARIISIARHCNADKATRINSTVGNMMRMLPSSPTSASGPSPSATEREARRHALGTFLRAYRDRLQPEDVGLKRRERSRVKGLRRHDVADIAGVSVTWYTWLEQGRNIHVSVEAIDSVCRALQMDEDAHRYARFLTGTPLVEMRSTLTEPRPDLVALLDELLPLPACITTGPDDLLAWNVSFCNLFGNPADLPLERRNTHWLHLNSEVLRNGIHDRERQALASTGRLRAESARYINDSRFQQVIEMLCEEDEQFRDQWESGHVEEHHGPHIETLDHPAAGKLCLQELHLRLVEEPALNLILFRPTDDETRAGLLSLVASAALDAAGRT